MKNVIFATPYYVELK